MISRHIYKLQREATEALQNITELYIHTLLSTPMGVDYVVIGFDMELQPLVTHNAA